MSIWRGALKFYSREQPGSFLTLMKLMSWFGTCLISRTARTNSISLPMSGPAPFGGGDFDDGAECDVNECLALLTHIARVERGQSSQRITGWRSHLDRGEGGREGAASCLTAQLQHRANIGSAIEDFGKKVDLSSQMCRRTREWEHGLRLLTRRVLLER